MQDTHFGPSSRPDEPLLERATGAGNAAKDGSLPELRGAEQGPGEIVSGEWPSPADVFYLQMAEKIALDTPGHLNQTIRQLVTLHASLLGGMIVFLDKKLISPWAYVLGSIGFLAGVVVCALGLIPAAYDGAIGDTEAFRDNYNAGIRWKSNLSVWAVLLLVLSLGVLAVGVISRLG